MTAGNLFCGFTATLKILEGALLQSIERGRSRRSFSRRDLVHSRARLFSIFSMAGSRVSAVTRVPFGREFDSLADIVSFGVAPALMVYRVVLKNFRARAGSSPSFISRAARCVWRASTASANHEREGSRNGTKNFTGFPIPAAAGLIASITLFLLWLAEGEHRLGNWRFVLPPLLLFLSFMMFSRFQYPSFKAINWKTKKSIPRFLVISILLILTVAVLRMDASRSVPRLFALRISPAVALARMASRD